MDERIVRFCEPENLVNGDTGADEGFFGDCLNYYYLMQWRMRKCERCTEYKNRAQAAEAEAETLRTKNAILRLRLDAGSPKDYVLTFYTVEEVSERLRILAYTLKRYINAGTLETLVKS